MRVEEEGDVGEIIVVVDYVGEIGHGFVPFVGGYVLREGVQ